MQPAPITKVYLGSNMMQPAPIRTSTTGNSFIIGNENHQVNDDALVHDNFQDAMDDDAILEVGV